MHTFRLILIRLISFALAGLVLAGVGTASASEAFDSASELVEQISEQDHPVFTADSEVDEPLDCPAFVSDFALALPLLIASRPTAQLPLFRSVLPPPPPPPPRLA
jgi:hypothetical protein